MFTYSGTLLTRETSKSYSALLSNWTLGTRWTWPSHLSPYTFVALLRFNHVGRNHRWRSRLSLRTSRARNTIFPLFESSRTFHAQLINHETNTKLILNNKIRDSRRYR